MLPITVVVPLASVRRTVPLRAVCSTDRSASTASDIGSPTSATPRASWTCWKSAVLIGCAEAGVVLDKAAVRAAAIRSRAEPMAGQRARALLIFVTMTMQSPS